MVVMEEGEVVEVKETVIGSGIAVGHSREVKHDLVGGYGLLPSISTSNHLHHSGVV